MTGISDYWRMYKARGLGRVWHHFKDITWFDWRHGTDTDTWLPISRYESAPSNIEFAIQYQPSFTSEIIDSLDLVAEKLGNTIEEYDFFDLGSGKGKVCFIADKYKFRTINGIEFYRPLYDIAMENKARIKSPEINFFCEDVTTFNFEGKKLVFFAYNPFQENIWQALLENITDKKYIVIYNNPVHTAIFKDKYIWHEKTGSKWENLNTTIFSNFPKP